MTVELLPCTEFPHPFHPLACAFAHSPEFRAARFPTTAAFLHSPESLQQLRTPSPQGQLLAALTESMQDVTLSPAQQENLRALTKSNGLAVVTGQQVGFLGGPLYTALKATAAITLARQLRSLCPHPVVPVFWIEDNDSDGQEAGTIYWWNPDGVLHRLAAASEEELLRPLSVTERRYAPTGQWYETVSSLLPTLPPELAEVVRRGYRSGNSWSVASLLLLHWLFAEEGLLFLRASIARRHALFVPILERAIREEQRWHTLLQQSSDVLRQYGYTAPIEPSFPLLHFHTPEGFRYRVRRLPTGDYAIAQQRYSPKQLYTLFSDQPTAFSPTALLRPLCQDASLPTIAVVLGPGEVAYWSQLRELYEELHIPMPVVFLRPSLTLIPPLVQRLLQREGWQPRQFLQPWHQLEQALLGQLPPLQDAEHLTADLRHSLQQWYDRSLSIAQALDRTLVPSLGATHHRIEQALARWQRRLRAALRRRSETALHRARRIWTLLYPEGQPQERLLSWLQLLLLCGLEQFRAALRYATTLPPATHALLALPPEVEEPAAPPAAETAQFPPQ